MTRVTLDFNNSEDAINALRKLGNGITEVSPIPVANAAPAAPVAPAAPADRPHRGRKAKIIAAPAAPVAGAPVSTAPLLPSHATVAPVAGAPVAPAAPVAGAPDTTAVRAACGEHVAKFGQDATFAVLLRVANNHLAPEKQVKELKLSQLPVQHYAELLAELAKPITIPSPASAPTPFES